MVFLQKNITNFKETYLKKSGTKRSCGNYPSECLMVTTNLNRNNIDLFIERIGESISDLVKNEERYEKSI